MKRLVIEDFPDEKAPLVEAFARFLRHYPLSAEPARPLSVRARSLFGAFPELQNITEQDLQDAKRLWERSAEAQAARFQGKTT